MNRIRNVPPRIRRIAALVPPSTVVADIGCDHGYLCCELLQTGRALRVLACDISAGSLAKAEALLTHTFPPERFSLRCGNGLAVLAPGEADTVVLTGMGGMRIQKILTNGSATAGAVAYLLLGPQKNVMQLRRFLAQHDYGIERETLIADGGRFYPLLLVRPGGGRVEEDTFWYFFGRGLLKESPDLLRPYLDHEMRQLETALAGAPDEEKEAFLRALQDIRKDLP